MAAAVQCTPFRANARRSEVQVSEADAISPLVCPGKRGLPVNSLAVQHSKCLVLDSTVIRLKCRIYA
jgi:hypothetical protein